MPRGANWVNPTQVRPPFTAPFRSVKCLDPQLCAHRRTPHCRYVTEIVVGGDCRWELGVPDEATSDLRFALRTDVRDYLVFADTAMEASAWVTAIKTAWKECQAKSRSVNMNAGGYGAIAKTNEEYQLLQAIASEAVHDDALADEDEDNDADDSGAAEPMGDDVDDDEDSIFLDRYLDMYNLPHTNERRQIFRHAIQIGRRVGKTSQRQRHVTIVYNPVSGAGKAKKNVDLTLAPVLDIAKVAYMVIATTHRGHAREIARTLDYSKVRSASVFSTFPCVSIFLCTLILNVLDELERSL